MRKVKNIKMSAKVTVVIPSQQNFIFNKCFSVFSQTYDDFEIVVINDGSTDPKYKSHKYLDKIHQIDLETNQNF